MASRVVITGMAGVAPCGQSPDFSGLGEYHNCFSRHESGQIIAPVPEFALTDYTGRFKQRRYLTRGAEFAVATAVAALKNSGYENAPELCGLFLGTGPTLDFSDESLRALWLLEHLPNTPASIISILLNITGENLTLTTACAAGSQAIGEGFLRVRHGRTAVALVGAGDSRLSDGGLLGYSKAGALYWDEDGFEPSEASRPFDGQRGGFIPGEGGAFFVLESVESALKRGAHIYGEICGYGSGMDAHSMTDPDPQGKGAEACVRRALADAGLGAQNIDGISAHGTSTPMNDMAEAAMLGRVFENCSTEITAFKSYIGHLSAACGAVELWLAMRCLEDGIWPAVRNLQDTSGLPVGGLNFVRDAHSTVPKQTILLENFGFGGQNSALVVRKWTP
ncbi:MAG: beta-ketoacyl-[acyl-carrier-protein] synthase family protein [Desulfovibrio sp.]